MKKFLDGGFEDYLILISRSKNRLALHLYMYYRADIVKYGQEDDNGVWIGLAPSYQKINTALTLTNDTIRSCNNFLEALGMIQFELLPTGEKGLKILPLKQLTEKELNKLYKEAELENSPIKDTRLEKKLKSLTDFRFLYDTYVELIQEKKPKLSDFLNEVNIRKEDIPEKVWEEFKIEIQKVRDFIKQEENAKEFRAQQSIRVRKEIENLISATKHTSPTKYNKEKYFGHFLIHYRKYYGIDYLLEVTTGMSYKETREFKHLSKACDMFKTMRTALDYIHWVFDEKVDEWKRFATGLLCHASLVNEFQRYQFANKKKKKNHLTERTLEVINKIGKKFNRDFSNIKKAQHLAFMIKGEKQGSLGKAEEEILKTLREEDLI